MIDDISEPLGSETLGAPENELVAWEFANAEAGACHLRLIYETAGGAQSRFDVAMPREAAASLAATLMRKESGRDV